MKRKFLLVAFGLGLAVVLFLLTDFHSGGSGRFGSPEDTAGSDLATIAGVNTAADPAGSGGVSVEPVDPRARDFPDAGFSSRTAPLVAALDAGAVLRINTGDGDRTFVTRPRQILVEGFQATVGNSRERSLPTAIRAYDAVIMGDDGLGDVRAAISVVNGAVAAELVEANGDVTLLRTNPETGGFDKVTMTTDCGHDDCVHDHEAGTFTAFTNDPEITEADWVPVPGAALDPEVLPEGGYDPATGRLDKYVNPLPSGSQYDVALKDMLVLVVLDKSVTGGENAANLANKASQYLARYANIASVYENQLGIRLKVQELILTPDTDGYTNIPESLGDFRTWVVDNRSYGTYRWNAAARWGTGLSGGTLGVAYVSTTSGNWAVSIQLGSTNWLTAAHEMGHNLGSSHSNGGIMNAYHSGDVRSFFQDVTDGETAAKDIYDYSRGRLYGSVSMRHPEQIPFANNDAVTTGVGQSVLIDVLDNDNRSVRNGQENDLSVAEVSRVYPISAGVAEVVGGQVRFTPADGYAGYAWFSYSLRGSVGNAGAGWLHRGDIAVTVGSANPNSLDLELAPGQEFSFRPSGGTPSIQSQPAQAHVTTARDDSRLIIIRVDAAASGSDTFTIRRDGNNQTVNITYLDDYRVLTPDVFLIDESLSGEIVFNPLSNDQAAGYRSAGTAATTIGLNANERIVTYYFRHAFDLVDVTAIDGLVFELLRDDGAIVYLNGEEVFRQNMPTGAVTAETLASGGVGGLDETTYFAETVGATGLVQGKNVVAVEVHQSSLTSSDVGFDLALTAQTSFGDVTLITPNSDWRYLDDGSSPGADWVSREFDDGDSATTVGFGDDPGAKFITTYYRREFGVADASAVTAMQVRLRRDDGAVVYLNGAEILRDNMPTGTVNYLTPSAGVVGGADEEAFYEFTVSAANLVNGLNVLAVEIHQQSGGSSDTAFDLELIATSAQGGTTLIETGSVWRYLDDGSDQGTGWRGLVFNDSSWAAGGAPLGYPWPADSGWPDGPGILGFGDPGMATPLAVDSGNPLFGGAFRLISVENLNPDKGSFSLETIPMLVNGQRQEQPTGKVTFTPTTGVRGVASLSYTVEDGAGERETSTINFVLPLAAITSPATGDLLVKEGSGVFLEGEVYEGGQPPLSGTVTPTWSVVKSPVGGQAMIGDANALRTPAVFSAPGEYVIRFTGDDSGFSTDDEVVIQVTANDPTDVPSEGLTARWRFDEGSGTVVADVVNGYDGDARNGAGEVWAAGVSGSAIVFNGEDDYIRLRQHNAAFGLLTSGSISVFFQTRSTDDQTLFGVNDSGSSEEGLRLFVDGGVLQFEVTGLPAIDETPLVAEGRVDDGRWHHAVVSVDPFGATTLSLDGHAAASGLRRFFGFIGPDRIAIGRDAPGGSGRHYFNGRIDEASLYSRALGSSEVSAMADQRFTIAPAVAFSAAAPVVPGNQLPLIALGPTVSPGGGATQPLALVWSQIDGPDAAIISGSGLDAVATFPQPGNYTLRLEVDDGSLTAFSDIALSVTGLNTGAPVALGIADVFTHQHAEPVEIDLGAAFWSTGNLNFTVAANTGPELFTQVEIVEDTLHLEFSGAVGTASIDVRATDSLARETATEFAVTVANAAPVIQNQTFLLAENLGAGIELGAVVATDPDGDRVLFSIVGGNGDAAFSIDPATGVLRSTDTAADFERVSEYRLSVAVTDATHPSPDSVAEVTVFVININEPPVIDSRPLEISDTFATGLDIGVVSASDPEGELVTFAITGGNASGAFSIDAESGVLTIADAGELNPESQPRINLEVTVQDASGQSAVAIVPITLTVALIEVGDMAHWLVPTDDSVDEGWPGPQFNDAAWASGPTGVGYEDGTGYEDYILTDVGAEMSGKVTSVYLRLRFSLVDPLAIGTLRLKMQYDDGFIAYLNGVRVASRNGPDDPDWESGATDQNSDLDAVEFEEIDISDSVGELVSGENILAIHGLNAGVSSSDFLIVPALSASAAGTAAAPVPPVFAIGTGEEIGLRTATLNATLESTGGEAPLVTMAWADSDRGTNLNDWPNTSFLGQRNEGPLSAGVDQLRPATDYFFRVFGINSGGLGVSAAGRFRTVAPDPFRLLTAGATMRYVVPQDDSAGFAWMMSGYNDSAWETGRTGIGYETDTGYESLVETDVGAGMFEKRTGVYLRLAFTAPGRDLYGGLSLRVKYDDGFVAFLNGLEVARRNAPTGVLGWDAMASANHNDTEAQEFEIIDISWALKLLQEGENILALHGLNVTPTSSDFLIVPELDAVPATPDEGTFLEWALLTHRLDLTAVSADADPDGDGLSNLLEYAFGGNPLAHGDEENRLPVSTLRPATGGNQQIELAYVRRIDYLARGLVYRVVFATDPAAAVWSVVGVTLDGSPVALGDGVTERVRVLVDSPVIPGVESGFYRIEVTSPD